MDYQAQEARLLERVRRELSRDHLQLPSLPESAAKVRDKLNREDCSVAEAVRALSGDPAIAARVIKVGNSAAYRRGGSVKDLRGAILRLGMTTVRRLVNALALLQSIDGSGPAPVQRRLRAIHEHLVAVSAQCYALAAEIDHLDPEQALLAGLTHDIGHLPLLCWAQENGWLERFPRASEHLIECLHPEVGAAILSAWNFPAEIVAAAAHHEDRLSRRDGDADYVDVVIVATVEARRTLTTTLSACEPQTIPAYARLGLRPPELPGPRFLEFLRIGTEMMSL